MAFTSAPAPGTGPNDVPRDSYGRYLIPRYPLDRPMKPGEEPIEGQGMNQPWTRVSTLAHTIADQMGLHNWKLRMLAKGIAIRPDLYVLAASTSIDQRDQMTSIVDQALDAADMRVSSNVGTALHSFTDLVDRGEDVAIPAPWDADIKAYQDRLAHYGIELIPGLQEVRVVSPHLKDGKAAGTAGTFDRIVRWRGMPIVADLKTGSDPLRYGAGSISIQLGRYASAWAMWDGKHFHPMPEGLRQDVALVIHLPAGKGECEVYALDLKPGHRAVDLAMQVRAWRRVGKELYLPLGEAEGWHEVEQEIQEADLPTATVSDLPTVATRPGPAAELPAPQVVDKPTGRACSVCRQPGHRKGSPKCSGAPVEPTSAEVPVLDADTSPVDVVGDLRNEIALAGSMEEIKSIRARAKAAGAWTIELLQIALERRDELTKTG